MPKTKLFIDNTLLTSSSRALASSGVDCSDFDFISLVELTQSMLMYDTLYTDASSRTTDEQRTEWNRATEPWLNLQTEIVEPISDTNPPQWREAALDATARRALLEASAGQYTATYRKTLADLGVENLLPAFYSQDNGCDDERFRSAEAFFKQINMECPELDPTSRQLARYVFRGYYYYYVALSQGIAYCPSTLRGRLMAQGINAGGNNATLQDLLAPIGAVLHNLDPANNFLAFADSLGIRVSLDLTRPTFGNTERNPQVPLTFLYVLNVCKRDNISIPSAVFKLRRLPQFVELRQQFGHVTELLHSPAIDAFQQAQVNDAIAKFQDKIAQINKITGVTPVHLPVLPLINAMTGPAVGVLKALISALPPHAITHLKLRLPGWLFKDAVPDQKLGVLWDILGPGNPIQSARIAFNEYMSRQPR